MGGELKPPVVAVIVFRSTAKQSRTIILSTAIQKLAPLTFFAIWTQQEEEGLGWVVLGMMKNFLWSKTGLNWKYTPKMSKTEGQAHYAHLQRGQRSQA